MRAPLALVLLVGVSWQGQLFACENWAAKIVSVNGSVVIDDVASQRQAERVAVNDVICPGDQITVGVNSRASLYLSNNSFVRLDQNSVLAFPKEQKQEGYWVQLKRGVSHFISRIKKSFVVDALYVNAVIHGTEFLVSATPTESSVTVLEGSVTAASNGLEQALTSGQQAVIGPDAKAFTVLNIHSADTVQWAVYYPPLLTLSELTNSENQNTLHKASEQIKQNRPDLALQTLNDAQSSDANTVAKASILLSVGQASQAAALLKDTPTAESLALQSIIATTQHNADAALEYANAAVQKNSQSVSALLAQSYALQSQLNLESALKSARDATQANPGNTYAWVRLAELHLTQGDYKQAKVAIEKASALDANSAHVLTQRGFVELFYLNIDAAKALFQQSLAQDSENPQAHLGLGLAMLRQGDLEQGRMQLEYATSLDPAQSVLRSYLGRAYFEEKRDKEASAQWVLAKEFDPKDPTPYFYEGVQKLYANDPIGAIEELEASQALNDERALYRSDALLQSDAASRSATLARAYNEVGYEQGVLLAGWKALSKDPTSSEGHRLLADAYRGDSRYDSARASELLQSQLWQPLSAYPLQPQLSETGISVIEGSGPQQPGFNEYHSLFTQDGVYGSATGYGGSDGTWADDLVGSFLAGPVAVSMGQYHYESDGWRENSGQEQDIYNGFVQWQIGSSTSIQFEHREFEWDKSFLEPELGDNAASLLSEQMRRDTDRVGMTYKINRENTFIFSVVKESLDNQQYSDSGFGGIVPNRLNDDFSNIEAQWVEKSDALILILGIEKYNLDQQEESITQFELDYGLIYSQETVIEYLKNDDVISGYGYIVQTLTEYFQLGFGLNYLKSNVEVKGVSDTTSMTSDYDGNVVSIDEPIVENFHFNETSEKWMPKLGFMFDVYEYAKISLVGFETVARPASGRLTIKPVTFLGNVQMFDDPEGTQSKNYILSLDFFGEKYNAGFNYQSRFLELPFQDVDRFEYIDQKVRGFQAYLNYYCDPDVVLSVDLLSNHRDISVEGVVNDVIDDIQLYEAPLKVKLFNDERWSFIAKQTYYRQKIKAGSYSDGYTSVWVTDLEAKYDLPSRLGRLTVGVNNLLDKKEEYINSAGNILAFYPGRLWYVSFNLNL